MRRSRPSIRSSMGRCRRAIRDPGGGRSRGRDEPVPFDAGAGCRPRSRLGCAGHAPRSDRAWGAAGGLYEIRVGADRADAMNPYRSMLERGVVLGAGSDAPVTPLDQIEHGALPEGYTRSGWGPIARTR